ncbi:PREDICTED: ovarian cancer-associated gene 2 protein homolog [Priapulus caudatus]|uniref:Ovarian cancer-associated gene 2 protein homolog n=1 Tax=Priapulus caudatus TaxID=37621 RepID=A0ABM1DUP7_PRICU|nr:PREDICTED: ovarian cancer-associated gene 2 protein homolog [Priapulus caudatus]
MSAPSNSKYKVLCIHGYRQNAKIFREKMGAFRKIMKSQAEFVFITAPNDVTEILPNCENAESATAENDSNRGWWFSTREKSYRAQDFTDIDDGFITSVDVIRAAFREHGPFDGVLGFSQGASMVSILCGMREQGDPDIQFKFAVLVAGYKSRSGCHDTFYTKPISVPSLHVFGDTDQVIPKEMSIDLQKYFLDPKTIEHPGGHFIPATGQHKPTYRTFIESISRS